MFTRLSTPRFLCGVKMSYMHPTAERLFLAVKSIRGIDGKAEPGRVAKLLGESAATVTNWKARGVSKQGMLKLNELLGVDPHWLATGLGDMHLAGVVVQQVDAFERDKSNVFLVGCNKKVPRLEWHEIQGYVKSMFTPPEERYEVVSSPTATDRCFLVEVDGDAMTSTTPSDSILQGSMLLCDPDREAEQGAIVVAMHPKSGEPVVRRLMREGGVWFLRAHNAAYPMIEIDAPAGVVVARAIEVITRRTL